MSRLREAGELVKTDGRLAWQCDLTSYCGFSWQAPSKPQQLSKLYRKTEKQTETRESAAWAWSQGSGSTGYQPIAETYAGASQASSQCHEERTESPLLSLPRGRGKGSMESSGRKDVRWLEDRK